MLHMINYASNARSSLSMSSLRDLKFLLNTNVEFNMLLLKFNIQYEIPYISKTQITLS